MSSLVIMFPSKIFKNSQHLPFLLGNHRLSLHPNWSPFLPKRLQAPQRIDSRRLLVWIWIVIKVASVRSTLHRGPREGTGQVLDFRDFVMVRGVTWWILKKGKLHQLQTLRWKCFGLGIPTWKALRFSLPANPPSSGPEDRCANSATFFWHRYSRSCCNPLSWMGMCQNISTLVKIQQLVHMISYGCAFPQMFICLYIQTNPSLWDRKDMNARGEPNPWDN